jgi:hypothetical protein
MITVVVYWDSWTQPSVMVDDKEDDMRSGILSCPLQLVGGITMRMRKQRSSLTDRLEDAISAGE